ncbi:MAG TPA: sigma 54-interacting transcriptional regulator [Polyangiaceae bacterium]|nr:sigma 54-interacting transcriptional regulator [Polyangiaceae bacterium]
MNDSNPLQATAEADTSAPSARPFEATLMDLMVLLRSASTFEEAAAMTLQPMLARASAALAASRFSQSGRIVRAMVHLRPDDGYRRLVVLEAGETHVSPVESSQTRLPSATAWRWVAERGQGVSIDVNLGSVQLDGDDPSKTHSDRRFSEGEFASNESRMRLLQRDVTHLHVLPLRGAGDRIDGILSLEADCRQAMGRPFIWEECAEQLQLFADCAAPYLANLPISLVPPQQVDAFLPVVGASMAGIIEMLRVFAQQEEPILISGPTGAGKSRLARWCHEHSSTRPNAFEILDLSTVPEELQMAELFGWKKGAFTGAIRDNPGLIARARGGTLFIDEIDNLSPRAQAGLLHVLEERTYRVLGDNGVEKPAEVRFIIGTNARLHQAVREKRFREDLYYRINVLPVKLPPLRDRPDEIPMWARYMANRRHTTRVPEGRVELSKQAEATLLDQHWPGNVRQLDNIVRRAYAIALMAHGGAPPRDLLLEDEHVHRALAYEESEETKSLVDALISAAVAFVSAAEKGAAAGTPLDLDLSDGFKGFVLAVATEKLGNREDAFRLFGREKLVTSRNHQKVFKRELERAENVCASVGKRGDFPFARFVEADSEPAPGSGKEDLSP